MAPRSQAPVVYKSSRGFYALGLKRVLDAVVVLAVLPFVLPFFALIALAISLDGHNPFFRQERVGLNGNRFRMWKFRTMVPNAELELMRYLAGNPEAQAEWNSRQKLEHDPRITRIGRLLRRTSLDELPQLFNVLTGQMALVGPRPMMPSQQALYPGHAYYRMRPGMTGAWQVSARNKSTFADRAKFDDHYESRLTFATDLALILRTVGVVLRGTGI